MKIYILILIIFLNSFIGIYSQQSIIATYKIFQLKEFDNKNDDKAEEEYAKKLLNEALELSKEFEFNLLINHEESLFQINNFLINEGSSNETYYNIALAMLRYGIYYQNVKEDICIKSVEISGQMLRIQDNLFKDWIIKDNYKKIGKFNCQKAVFNCENCKMKTEVWFTQNLSFPFGPLGYGGLPGLIIEIDFDLYKISLVKLETKKIDSIIKPAEGKLMTVDEYEIWTKEIREKIKGN